MRKSTTEAAFCPKCHYVTCVCALVARHKSTCPFRRAASLTVELACSHGFQACPKCDACDCRPHIVEEGIR